MFLTNLLEVEHVDPRQVLVLRHRPNEPNLAKVLPWLAADKPDVFNAYQQTQGERLQGTMERMKGSGYVASFIGHEPGKALFVGLYSIDSSRKIPHKQFWRIPAYQKLRSLGMRDFAAERAGRTILWFDLTLLDFYAIWKGKLIVGWPPPERSWWRRAHKNDFPVLAVLEESAFDAAMPDWSELNLTWEQLGVLPKPWKAALSQWRGIYYIFDTSDGKGYAGSAYGESNILGRWLNYAARGHGGNSQLRNRDPRNFRFSILQRVSPDMDARDIILLESSWKERLHTRRPHGLNDN